MASTSWWIFCAVSPWREREDLAGLGAGAAAVAGDSAVGVESVAGVVEVTGEVVASGVRPNS